jgi:hypothetical protein
MKQVYPRYLIKVKPIVKSGLVAIVRREKRTEVCNVTKFLPLVTVAVGNPIAGSQVAIGLSAK